MSLKMMWAKRDGKCCECNKGTKIGTAIVYFPENRAVMCHECWNVRHPDQKWTVTAPKPRRKVVFEIDETGSLCLMKDTGHGKLEETAMSEAQRDWLLKAIPLCFERGVKSKQTVKEIIRKLDEVQI